MTGPARQPSKFLAVIEQLQKMIQTDRLQSGDKIPSERELSERFSIGRSSVREALRALELLGLIETRRGEGTFLRDFNDHHLVPLIGAFIFDSDQKKEDVLEVKAILELGCLALLAARPEAEQTEENAFSACMEKADNRLLQHIWKIVSDYAGNDAENKHLRELLSAVKRIRFS